MTVSGENAGCFNTGVEEKARKKGLGTKCKAIEDIDHRHPEGTGRHDGACWDSSQTDRFQGLRGTLKP